MSKASDMAAQYAAIRPLEFMPAVECRGHNKPAFVVSEKGHLWIKILVGRSWYEIPMDAVDAKALGRWLMDTF